MKMLVLMFVIAQLLAATGAAQPFISEKFGGIFEEVSDALSRSERPRGDSAQDEERPLRTLDSHFPFVPPKSVEEWQGRAERLRFHLQMSLGLWPLPDRTPLNAVIHGRIDLGDYSVEKVFFESFPGYFVSGNLYRPTQLSDSLRPAILCPHGHYANGRFYDAGPDEIKRAIGNGEETFESNARSPLQARCAHLARMGCTVFHYDMIGYADSQQIPASIAHDFQKQRPDENGADGWGFFSPRAEMHLQSIMGLQTWNSMRAMDFVQSLPDVDPNRIGVTGSSGGGTQAFVLAALDDRVTAVFPAVMVSTGMQGGCTCENCCNLRVGTGNVEIAALFAPKPMGLSAANDWTRTMPEDGFPQLQELYQLMGKPENVYLTASTGFPHGYNQIARRVMYAWFDKHLNITGNVPDIAEVEKGNLPDASPWKERESRFLSKTDLSVWDETHPAPESGTTVEHLVTAQWSANQQQMLQTQNGDKFNAAKLAVRSLLCKHDQAIPHPFPFDQMENQELSGLAGVSARRISIASEPFGPYEFLYCPGKSTSGKHSSSIVCLVTNRPMDQFVQDPPEILGLLLKTVGTVVVMAGDGLGKPNTLVNNGREAAGYTFGYNRSRLADSAAALTDLLDSLDSISPIPGESSIVDFVLTETMAPVGILAAAANRMKTGTMILRDDFRFASVDDLSHQGFLPGSLLAGDIPGIIAIANPSRIIVVGEVHDDLSARIQGEGRIESVNRTGDAILKYIATVHPACE